MILLCLADDIEVIFYETEMDTGKKTWEDRGVFSPTDVHRQVILKQKLLLCHGRAGSFIFVCQEITGKQNIG